MSELASPLPTTSYAILGMLALRPWSAYELTRQLRRSLDYCWPTAESVWYSEPKRLVRLGLATALREPAATGQRTRTVYAITAQGRELLSAWLATKPEPPRLQAETILRLLYADQGSTEDLLTAVRNLQQWAIRQAAAALPQIRGYLDEEHPTQFAGRLHIIALIARFHTDVIEQMELWARQAEAEIRNWPSTAGLGMTQQARATLQDLVSRLEQHTDRAAAGLVGS